MANAHQLQLRRLRPPPSHRVSVLIALEGERDHNYRARNGLERRAKLRRRKLLTFHLRMRDDVARDVAALAEAERSKARPDDSIKGISFRHRERYRSRIALPDEWRCHPVVN